MFVELIASRLGKYLHSEFKEEALGDWWEEYENMLEKGKPRIQRNIVIFWRALNLLVASYQISKLYSTNPPKQNKVPRRIVPLLFLVFFAFYYTYILQKVSIFYGIYKLLTIINTGFLGYSIAFA